MSRIPKASLLVLLIAALIWFMLPKSRPPVSSPRIGDQTQRVAPKGPRSVTVIPLKYAKATDAADILRDVSAGNSQIVDPFFIVGPLPWTNAILVFASEELKQDIIILLDALDEAARFSATTPVKDGTESQSQHLIQGAILPIPEALAK